MIKNYKLYTESKNSLLNLISKDFWKMVEIADWQKFINEMKKDETVFNKELEKVKGRIFKNFNYESIQLFKNEYEILYKNLHNKFNYVINISDDEYMDLISSIIAKGEDFIKKALTDKNLILKMVNDDDYYENFKYVISVGFEEYHKIKMKYDDFYRDISKYNL